MNWNFNFTWNSILYAIRNTIFPRHKYHCNICGYPTNDINKLYAHGIKSHQEIMHSKLLGTAYDNTDDDNYV